jgi:hypothetical protein
VHHRFFTHSGKIHRHRLLPAGARPGVSPASAHHEEEQQYQSSRKVQSS